MTNPAVIIRPGAAVPLQVTRVNTAFHVNFSGHPSEFACIRFACNHGLERLDPFDSLSCCEARYPVLRASRVKNGCDITGIPVDTPILDLVN